MRFQLGTAGQWRAWFTAGRLPWLSVGLAAVGVAWWALCPQTQDTARRIGLLYEVVGIVVVFVEIFKASGNADLDPWHIRFIRYWRAVPFLAPSRRVVARGSSNATMGEFTSIARGGPVATSSPTIEQRVATLEGKAAALEGQQAALRDRLVREERARAAAMQQEANARLTEVDALKKRIRELETGGLDLSLFGVFWLLVGVVMTTGTPELCRWVLPGCR